jgi:hypothetical protein
MLLTATAHGTRACSRSEGRDRRHAGIFHEALDLIAARQKGSR